MRNWDLPDNTEPAPKVVVQRHRHDGSPVVNRDKRVTAERIKYMHENGLEFLADRYVAGWDKYKTEVLLEAKTAPHLTILTTETSGNWDYATTRLYTLQGQRYYDPQRDRMYTRDSHNADCPCSRCQICESFRQSKAHDLKDEYYTKDNEKLNDHK